MIFRWSDRREPRPNVKVHPLDAYDMPKRLRGDVDEDDHYHPEWALVYLFVAFVIGGVVGMYMLRFA